MEYRGYTSVITVECSTYLHSSAVLVEREQHTHLVRAEAVEEQHQRRAVAGHLAVHGQLARARQLGGGAAQRERVGLSEEVDRKSVV